MAVEHIPGWLFWEIYVTFIGGRNSPVWEESQMFCREIRDGQVWFENARTVNTVRAGDIFVINSFRIQYFDLEIEKNVTVQPTMVKRLIRLKKKILS